MSSAVPLGKCHPGPGAQRLGLRVSMCGIGRRIWRPELDGARWTIPDWGLVQLLSGSGSCEGAGCRQRTVQAGDVVVLLPGIWHFYGPWRGGDWPESCVFFNGPAAAGLAAALGWSPTRNLLRPTDAKAVQAASERIIRDAHAGNDSALTPGLLALLLELERAVPVDAGEADAFQDLLAAIRDDPLHPWDLAAEARRLEVSAATLRRRFAELVGVAPLRYLAEQRIRLAASRMRDGLQVAEAGRSVGFPDPAHFSRRFRAITGRSPRAYLAAPEDDG